MALSLPSPSPGQRTKKTGFRMETWSLAAQGTGRWLDLVAAAARSGIVGAATVAAALLRAVAVGAVNGAIATGRERHLGVSATLGAHRRVHLAFATAVAAAVAAAAVTRSLAGGAAVGTATRGGKPLGLIEFLFTFGERKLVPAVSANEVLVRHVSLANSC